MSEITGVSQITLRQYIREGKIEAFKSGKTWCVPNEEVARYWLSRIHNRSIDKEEEIYAIWIEGHDVDDEDFIVDSFLVTGSELNEIIELDNDERSEQDFLLRTLGYHDGDLDAEYVSGYLAEYAKVRDLPYAFYHLEILKDEDKEMRNLSPEQRQLLENFCGWSGEIETDENGKLTGLPYRQYEKWSKLEAKKYYYQLFSREPVSHELQLFFELLNTRANVEKLKSELANAKEEIERLK